MTNSFPSKDLSGNLTPTRYLPYGTSFHVKEEGTETKNKYYKAPIKNYHTKMNQEEHNPTQNEESNK